MPSAPDATALWQPPGVGYSVVKEGRGMNARGGAQLPDESVISGLDRKKTSQLLQVGGVSPYHATRSILRACLPSCPPPPVSSLPTFSAPCVQFQPGSLPSLPFMRPQRFPCFLGQRGENYR